MIGYHHVQLAMPPGPQAEADAVGFYEDLLGLTRISKPEHLAARGGCWFRSGPVELHLGVEEPFAPARKAHPALLVEGLDSLERRLLAGGVAIEHDTQLEGHERFYVRDPFGNRLELLKRSITNADG